VREAHLAKEPCDDIAENNTLVSLVVAGRCWDPSQVPEVAFPLVKAVILAAGIEEEDVWITVDQPATVEAFNALHAHRIEGTGDVGIGWLLRLHLHGGGFVREWADEGIPVAKLGDGDGDLGLDDGVDTADLVCDLPCALEKNGFPDVAFLL
jgi:hypothetical protein